MNNKKRAKLTGKGGTVQSFAGIPRNVMRSRDFRELSSSAIRILLWLAWQYRGSNNGDLSATHSQAKDWGVLAKDTLTKSLRELAERGFIIKTREGRFLNPGARCDLFALTWAAIDECPGKDLEVSWTRTPPRQAWDV